MFENNNNFFPTPPELIDKMINKLGKMWKNEIKYVLEPSAGSGNLVEGLQNKYMEGYDIGGFWVKPKAKCDITFDCVEIDERLVNILRGKNMNVVAYDFLTYNPNRYYSLILANFPFSDCEKHLLKAISIQERMGGKIVAITSASILENTYSKERIILKNKLDELNVDIEYIDNAFIEAERTTGVRIALIYIDIPMKKQETMFEREFKRDNYDISFTDANTLAVKRNKLEQLVFEYQLVIDRTLKLFEEKARIDSLLKSFGLENKVRLSNDLTRADKIEANEFIESTNQQYWNKFIDETNFEAKLPSALLDNFRSNMQKQRNISFNLENVKYFYQELMSAIPKSYEETVAKVFKDVTQEYAYTGSSWDKTIRYYNSWKTNKSYCINKKVIIPFYNNGYLYNIPKILYDLNVIFNNIEGTSYDIGKDKEVLESIKNYDKKVDTPSFILDIFRKGTIHITFKNKKTLAIFNLLAGKGSGWLKGDFDNTRYEDMTEEEQNIVKVMGFEPSEFNNMKLGKVDYLRLN